MPTAPTGPPTANPRGWMTTSLGRVLSLIGLVAASGIVVGFALAWPVSQIELDVRTSKQLNQDALAGTFDPGAALATLEDAPEGWVEGDPGAVALLSLVGQPICGTTPTLENSIGEPMQAVFRDTSEREFLISQVLRARAPRDANQYVSDLTAAFDSCTSFFLSSDDGSNTEIDIRAGQSDPPVTDYVSRTLVAEEGAVARRVVFFQVGNVVVALQAVGPTLPSNSVLGDAQLAILQRVAPEEFPKSTPIDGAKPLPPEATTTTTEPPTTIAPTTTEPPATTTAARTRSRRSATTAPPATEAPPAPDVPADAPAGE